MNMPRLPDVDEQSWNSFSADRWFKQTSDRINSISQMAVQPGLGFLNSSSNMINSLQIPAPPPIAPPQPVPVPQPAPAPVPLPSPTPLPAPVPAPAPAPPLAPPTGLPPPTGMPPVGLPPSPTPEPVPPGPVLPVPQVPGVPQVPQVPGGQPSLPQPPVWAPPEPTPEPKPGPFADQTPGGPFAPAQATTTTTTTTTTTRGPGGTTQTSGPVNYDPNAPAMQALNAAPPGELQNYARQAALKAGIDPELFAAQIQQESGYNPKAGSPAGAMGVAQIVPRYHPGVDPSDPYASLDYAANLDRKLLDQYGGDWQKALIAYNGGGGAVQAWESGQPYQESQTYVARILGNSRPNAQAQPAAAPTTAGQAPRPVPTALAQSQFGDPQLTTDEAYAACGPAAAVRFAQAYGRNPTLREATDLAKTVGWTSGSGMAGISSEQKLLQKLGIPTRVIGADVQAMAHEAQTGNPVTISTPGHYFYADGYNPQTGQFHVGRSGLDLKGGAEWMTAAEMQNVMGNIQGALFADNPQTTAVSTTAPVTDQLDQTRSTISAQLTGKPVTTPNVPPIPRQAMTEFGASSDPQVQHLDQAVQSANQPPRVDQRPSYLSTFDVAPTVPSPGTGGSGNPFDAIGQAISSAIQNALGGLGGGGGPRRPQDQGADQQDQQPGVMDRSRQMIEQFNTLPGGRTLQDLGVPNILPPDTSGKSPGEAILETARAAGEQALNRQSPTLGPGGLGVYDPRLGADPRQDVPPFLDPAEIIGELVGRIRGGGRLAEEAARTLEESFARGTALAPEGVSAGVASPTGLGSLAPIASRGERSIAEGLSRSRPQQAWDAFVRNYSDRNVDINHIAEDLSRRLGRPLRDEENLALLARFDPTHQASTATEMAIGPSLRAVPGEALQDTYDLIKHQTNLTAAEGLGTRVEEAYLEQGMPAGVEQRMQAALDDWNAAQDALSEAQRVQSEVASGRTRTRESISLDAAQSRVENAQARLEAAAEVARQTNAETARQRVLTAPGARVVTNAESRDLIIAEENARKLNQQYERLFNRNPDDPYVNKLGAQVGRAEDRAARLRAQLGERSATRGETIEGRAQTAADTAFTQQPRYAPTPEYAAAQVRLRYEQQNFERLQNAARRGQKGLTDDLARAERRVKKAYRDYQQVQKDLPEAARAQGWAQTTGRTAEGQTYEQVQQALSDLQARYADQPDTWRKMQEAAEAAFGYDKHLLQEKVDAGLISQADADNLMRLYPKRTPTRMLDYLTDEGPRGLPRGSKFNVNDAGFRRYTLEGSQGEQQNHIASLVDEADRTYALAHKNRKFQALVNAQGGEGGSLKKIADDWDEYNAAPAGSLHPPDYTPKPGQGEFKISGFVDGKKQEYVTSNPYVKAAVDNVSGDPDLVTQAASKLTQAARTVLVSRNPLWLAGNSITDALGYSIGTTARGGLARNVPSMALNLGPAIATAKTTDPNDPHRGHKIAAAAVAGIGARALMGNRLGLGPSATREFLAAYADVLKGLGSGRMTGEGVRELRLGGGGMRGGNFFGGGVQAGEERLRQLTRQNAFQVRNWADGKQLFDDAAKFGWVEALGNRFEQAPRVAAMRVARQQGRTPLEAMARARDVTIDFDRGGNFSKAMNRWVPFFNAGTQAGAQFGRLWKADPAGMAMAGTSLVGIPTVAAEQWNRSDPQRSQDYDNVPQYLKDQGVVIMLPGEAPRDKNGNRVPQHIDINLREFAPFAVAAREAYNRISGEGQARSAGELIGASTGQLSPFNIRSAGEATFGLLPTGLRTVGELGMNRDLYRDATIANQFSDENASALGKTLAPIIEAAVTRVPGASAARIRPSQVDFAVRDVLGGQGTLGLGISNRIAGTPPRAEGLAGDIPVVGAAAARFVRTTGGQEREDVTRPEAMLAPDLRRQMRAFGDYWEPSPVQSQIQKVPLREAEQVEYQRLANQYLDVYLRRVLDAHPQMATNEKARDYFRNQAVTAAHERAGREVLKQIKASGSSLPARYKAKSSAY